MKNKKVIIDPSKVIKTMPQMIKEDFSNLPVYKMVVSDKESDGITSIVLTDKPMCGVGFLKLPPCKKRKYSFNYDEAVKQGIITKKQANEIKRAERNGAIITFKDELFFVHFGAGG